MKTVFFDVDTQMDFLYPAGALYAPGAEQIVDNVARLNRFAAANSILVISDTDAHTEDDPEFQEWPPHCIAGTLGQHKPAETLLEKRAVVGWAKGDYDIIGAEQVILEKQDLDCFANPNLPGLLNCLGAERYVVYGVVTEYCVRCAAFGLLKREQRVEVVTDAIRALNAADGQRILDEFVAAGGRLTTKDQVISGAS